MPAKTAQVRPVRVALFEPPRLAIYPIAAADSSRPFNVSLGCSLLLHAVLVFGVGFVAPSPPPPPSLATLEVVLVNSKSASAPVNAEVAAQANLDGGGNTDRDVRAKSPFPVMKQEKQAAVVQVATKKLQRDEEKLEEAARRTEQEAELAQRKVEELEKQAQQLLTAAQSETTVAPRTEEAPQPETSPGQQDSGPSTADLLSRSFEIARLEATIAKDWNAYQKRPRMKFVGARTKEVRFASYIESWRQKVERVGNLNYPDAARQQRLYGSLQLTVGIRWDGTLESVELNRSSGHKVLDAAALRIVELAAPYAPFPEEIRRDTDVLHITRTWTFTTRDQLVAD